MDKYRRLNAIKTITKEQVMIMMMFERLHMINISLVHVCQVCIKNVHATHVNVYYFCVVKMEEVCPIAVFLQFFLTEFFGAILPETSSRWVKITNMPSGRF